MSNDDSFEKRSNNQKYQFHHLSIVERQSDNFLIRTLLQTRSKHQGLPGLIGAPSKYSSFYEESVLVAPTFVLNQQSQNPYTFQMEF